MQKKQKNKTKNKKTHPKVTTCHLHQFDYVLHVGTIPELFLTCKMWILEMKIFLVQIQTLQTNVGS
jgi:hypothetical protein